MKDFGETILEKIETQRSRTIETLDRDFEEIRQRSKRHAESLKESLSRENERLLKDMEARESELKKKFEKSQREWSEAITDALKKEIGRNKWIPIVLSISLSLVLGASLTWIALLKTKTEVIATTEKKWIIPKEMRTKFEDGRYIYVQDIRPDQKIIWAIDGNQNGRYIKIGEK